MLHGFYVPEFNFSRYASPGYGPRIRLQRAAQWASTGASARSFAACTTRLMFFNVRSVAPADYTAWLQVTGAFQRAHPSSIGQLPADLHANQNGTVPGYTGNSGNTGIREQR